MSAQIKNGGPVDVLDVPTLIAEMRRQAAQRNATWPCLLLKDLVPLLDDVAELIEDHKALYRHYVHTLESGRDKIIALGGCCDPVDRMEQSDPVLARSRAVLARIGGSK